MSDPRPILDELVGQDRARHHLVEAVQAGRLHHAYLLVGPEGVGKRLLARGMAQLLLCSHTRDGRACSQCPACRQVARTSHPDLHWVEPQARAGGPGSLGIDQVRRLIQEAAWRPYEGRWKVLVVGQADRLTPEAQNSLLKLLEEPPGTAVIFLTTSRPDRLLPTVRSRCHTVPLRALTDDEVREVLTAQGLIDPSRPEEAKMLVMAVQGAPGRAAGLDPNVLRERQQVARAWVEALLTEPGWRRLALAEELSEREDLVDVLDGAVFWVRELIESQCGDGTGAPVSTRLGAVSLDRLVRLWRGLTEARQLVQGPAQRRLVLDRLALTSAEGGPSRAG